VKYIAFTDGSSRGNPGPGGWACIVASLKTVVEYGGREAETTNNRMEMFAVASAIQSIETGDEIIVHTDSTYVMKGATSWIKGWKRNGWKTASKKDVENRDLWELIDGAMTGKKVSFVLVKGHAGIPGNERCDEIATTYADDRAIHLYNGLASQYTVSFDVSVAEGDNVSKLPKKPKSGGFYISLVKGVLEKHTTWDTCKARVSGVSGAKFKKVASDAEVSVVEKVWRG
jgi:ribonuclease HI